MHVVATFLALGFSFGALIYGSKAFNHLVPIALAFEPILLLGSFQVIIEGVKRRHAIRHPSQPNASMRSAELIHYREKVKSIRELFDHDGPMTPLAKELVDQWEWRQDIKRRTNDPALQIAASFYRPPSSGNIATLAAGSIAIFAAIVIATLDRETFLGSLPTIWNIAISNISSLAVVVILPIAAAIYPAAIFWTFCRSLISLFLEAIDDDNLSRRTFYDFIEELIEIDDRQEKRLLMRTTGMIYWPLRILTTDISNTPKVYRSAQRARRLHRKRKVITQ